MLDANGRNTVLSLNDALVEVLADASAAGVDVPSESVESKIANWLAQDLVRADSGIYASTVKQFNPTGTDIDIQNPGAPRLAAAISSAYLKIDNSAGTGAVEVTADMIFTAPNGNTYTNGVHTATVPAHEIGYVSVYSTKTGSSQNLPSGQTFTSSLSPAIVTNPQPFVNGRDLETDSEYTSRLVWLKTNNSSQQATPAATRELLDYYSAARIYVNNSSSDLIVPVPIPTGGYIAVVMFPSGKTANADEISNAINILVNRFEFGNIITGSTAVHPILTGVVYDGTFPQVISVAPAQAVKVTINLAVTVSFAGGTASAQKAILASAFATAFVQNIMDFYGGSAGSFNLSFQEAGSPVPSPVTSTPAVVAATGITDKIGPLVAIEQIRALISDRDTATSIVGLNYKSCTTLTAILDPQEAGEPTVELSIAAPAGGTVSVVDFVHDALFTDSTSWYDRYLFLDPSLITVTVNEA